ncbi:MAG TPA: RHS repeat-associated core domain-containing protein [Thermoanaerobaculia bacterium]|jgi:RHS repeat-associated protein
MKPAAVGRLLPSIAFALFCAGFASAEVTGDATAKASVDIHRNAIGRLTSVGNPQTRTFHEYDELGRDVGTLYVHDGQAYRFTSQYGYPQTAAGPGTVVVKQIFPDGEEVSYSYDTASNQIAVRSTFAGATENIVTDVRKTARGKMASISFANGTVTTFEYEDTGHLRLRRIRTVNAAGAVIQDFSYTYDGNGNVTGTTNGVRADQSITLDYDSLDQLTNVFDSGGNVLETYEYDPIGNLIRKGPLVQEYDPARPHALVKSGGTAYGYDPNGNVITAGAMTIEWNSQNMPVAVTAGGSAVTRKSYVDGSLWKKEEQGVTTYYLPSMRVENGVFRKYYGDFAERTEGSGDRRLRFYHADHLGSSSAMTDHTGAPIRRVSYFPWGQDRGVDATFTPKLQFNFKEKDATGFYDYGARLYNPVTGRWLSPDASIADGLNRYSYARNNPWSKIDPSGNRSCCEDEQDPNRRVATPDELPNETLERIDDGTALIDEYLNEVEGWTSLDAWLTRIPRFYIDEGSLTSYRQSLSYTETDRHLSSLIDDAIKARDGMSKINGASGMWIPINSKPVLYFGTGDGDAARLFAKAKKYDANVVGFVGSDATDRDIYLASANAFRKTLEAGGTVIMDLRESGGKYWVYEATLTRRFARICGECAKHIVFLTPSKAEN